MYPNEVVMLLRYRLRELIAASRDLAIMMDQVREGTYKPDSSTTQPVKDAIKDAEALLNVTVDPK